MSFITSAKKGEAGGGLHDQALNKTLTVNLNEKEGDFLPSMCKSGTGAKRGV